MLGSSVLSNFASQVMIFFVTNIFNKCEQIRRKLPIWSHLLTKTLTENTIFVQHIDFLFENLKSFSEFWQMSGDWGQAVNYKYRIGYPKKVLLKFKCCWRKTNRWEWEFWNVVPPICAPPKIICPHIFFCPLRLQVFISKLLLVPRKYNFKNASFQSMIFLCF